MVIIHSEWHICCSIDKHVIRSLQPQRLGYFGFVRRESPHNWGVSLAWARTSPVRLLLFRRFTGWEVRGVRWSITLTRSRQELKMWAMSGIPGM